MLPDGFRRMNECGARHEPFFFMVPYSCAHARIFTKGEAEKNGILFQVHECRNYSTPFLPESGFSFSKYPVPFTEYHEAFSRIIRHIRLGNSYLVNLTFPTPIRTSLDLAEIFYRSHCRYKALVPGQFVVFSPEKFIQITGGEIAAFPMKGTIDASLENSRAILLRDPKELAEHYTIVDLLRNDLSLVAHHVRVKRFRFVEKIETNYHPLYQVSSEISGRLPHGYEGMLGDIIYRLLPAGSVTGAPKKKTLEIIRESEKYDRGYYTGIMGWFDGQNLDCGVMIRFIEKGPAGLLFKSGGGITASSDPETEYTEMIDKVYVPFT